MLILRLAKIVMVTALGAFAFIVTYDNIVDYGSNYDFVRHVLSMDTDDQHRPAGGRPGRSRDLEA
jgi:predicted small integral membrane protein